MSRSPLRSGGTTYDSTTSSGRSASGRITMLLSVIYLSVIGGLAFSLVGDPTDPGSTYGVVGIALMGLSFVALFVLSITVTRLTDG